MTEALPRSAVRVWRYCAWSLAAMTVFACALPVLGIFVVPNTEPAIPWGSVLNSVASIATAVICIQDLRWMKQGSSSPRGGTFYALAVMIGILGILFFATITGPLLLTMIALALGFALSGRVRALYWWYFATALVIAAGWLRQREFADTSFWLYTVFCAAAVWLVPSTRWLWNAYIDVEHARRTSAENAVLNERLRFSTELHDVQGHSLQVVALKAELARRTLASDPEAASEYLREVESLAQQTLSESRALALGYRVTSLDTELANASEVLRAAGVEVTAELAQVHTSPAIAQLLGLVAREATTNILRHADAENATLSLVALAGDRVRLEVSNDGVSSSRGEDGKSSGLASLGERVQIAGGILKTRREPRRFELTVEVPVGR